MPIQRPSVGREVRSIRRSLASIGVALERLAPALQQLVAAPAPRAGKGAAAPLKRTKMSASRLAALKLHGQYIGYMRNLKPRQKAQVQALRQSKGVEAAIALGKKLARA